MKSYSEQILTEKQKSSVTTFLLVKIGTYCFTDSNIDIQHDGNTYQAYPLQISNIKSSDVSPLDGCTIKIGNVNLTLSSLVLNNLLKEKEVSIYEGWFNADGGLIEAVPVFFGKVDGRSGVDELWATITAMPFHNPWTSRCPRRRISKHCGWLFKDEDCGYSGAATSCNKTWQRCTELGNTAGFGGFRFIPQRGRKFVWGNTIIEVK
jgi:hypothetical protein